VVSTENYRDRQLVSSCRPARKTSKTRPSILMVLVTSRPSKRLKAKIGLL
jgi:hypothetical protein